MAKIFRNYTTLAEYEADTNKPANTVCFIKDAKVIYVDGIQYSYKQLDYLPPAITEAEALEYMGKIVKNAKEVGLIYAKPVHTTVPTIYWTGNSNTINISGMNYTAQADKVNIDGVEYYQVKLYKDLDNNFRSFAGNTNNIYNLIFKDVDTSNVTSMESMFDGCTKLVYLDMYGFDTSNVTSMMKMFNKCNSLTSLNVSWWNTSKVTDIRAMFQYCYNLTSLGGKGSGCAIEYDCKGRIPDIAFNGSEIVSIEFSDEITEIGKESFFACNDLLDVNIPGNIKK